MEKRTSANANDNKKERVIHTRVPEALDDEVRRRAGHLGLSVSNLVRNVLENTFGLVEDIVADSAGIALSARGRMTSAAHREGDDRILGWTLAIMNVNAVCGICNAILAKGTQAGISVRRRGAAEFRCGKCLEESKHES